MGRKIRQHYLRLGIFFLTVRFIVFDYIVLSDLNSNPNNLIEILFIIDFLVDCLMCLNISLVALQISKSSLSISVLINLHPSPYSTAFCVFILKPIFLLLCPFSSISIVSL